MAALHLGTTTMELPDDFVHEHPTIVSAHRRCRNVGKDISRMTKSSSVQSETIILHKQLVNVRILGHLLAIGPSDAAKTHIAKTILSCEDDGTLIQQGEFYDKHFIRACKLLVQEVASFTDSVVFSSQAQRANA